MHVKIISENSPSLTNLLCELSEYYKAGTADRAATLNHIEDNLLAKSSPVRLVVAENEDRVVMGFVAIILLNSLVNHSGSERFQCLLKELFVGQYFRGKGVGDALMQWVAAYAIEQGCGRIDWNVKANNLRGIKFYEGLGAHRVGDRLSYRIEGQALIELSGVK